MCFFISKKNKKIDLIAKKIKNLNSNKIKSSRTNKILMTLMMMMILIKNLILVVFKLVIIKIWISSKKLLTIILKYRIIKLISVNSIKVNHKCLIKFKKLRSNYLKFKAL